ncbi:MAG: penicillin-binding transpeptidase domain-containing protein [Oscillospiraceae bacterium]|nr:penicillin-binding transpeptidase domain-containing protein [Oscillospiraceae bacterium]
MTRKRVYLLFFSLAVLANILMLRLYTLMSDARYAEAADRQSTYTSVIARRRPDFYDRNGRLLTGIDSAELAVVLPADAAAWSLTDFIAPSDLAAFRDGMKGSLPFVVPLASPLPAALPVRTVSVSGRSGRFSLARHLIGYLDYAGKGATGLERVFETYLSENTVEELLRVRTDARGRALDGADISLCADGQSAGGIVLTLDAGIQYAAERIADSSFRRGAIVVADCATGELLALVSRPNYDQNDVAASIARNDTSLFDRVTACFNVGSVYKPVIACAALDAGVGADFTYECTGEIEVDGVVYGCNNKKAHGTMTLETALAQSCNTYFIALGQKVGAEAICNTAQAMGLGRPLSLWDGYGAGEGSFPGERALAADTAELCNHCFGQGRLLLSPLHVAACTVCIADGGVYRELSVVKSVGGEAAPAPRERRAVGEAAARTVAQAMCLAMQSGTGAASAPQTVTAGGKTGTAQTGTFNDDGSEAVIGWCTGFFPAQAPRWTVTVMVENEGYGYESAAPVFGRLADAITALERAETA